MARFSFISIVLFLIRFITTFAVSENSIDIGKSSKLFAAKIYQELSKSGGDVLVSPASLQAALGLLQLGAEGPTASELSETLSLPVDRHQLLQTLFAIQSIFQDDPNVQTALANAVYARSDIKINEEFNSAINYLQATINSLNPDSDVAVAEVNNWIMEASRGLLGNVLSPGDISFDTALLLINVLYYKGYWRDANFEVNKTHSALFNCKGQLFPVEMMHTVGSFDIGRDYELNATFLELAYKGDNFVFTIVLPDEVDGLPRLIKNIDRVLNSPPTLLDEQVELQLPKFRTSAAVHLKPVLQQLGIKHTFSAAHFSGLTADRKPLAVSDVVHDTLLEVSENGTEAAAATVIGITDRIFSPPIQFVANHPFLFTLQHKPTGLILFIGDYSYPKS